MWLIQKELKNAYIWEELWSYSKIISMSEEWQTVLDELNTNPSWYYNKLNNEWHILANVWISNTEWSWYQMFKNSVWNYLYILYINWSRILGD